jgi:hypothetical protein
MKGISFGDEIAGEKIVLEAGHVDLEKHVQLSKSRHHGDRATGRKNAWTFIDKEFVFVGSKPLK